MGSPAVQRSSGLSGTFCVLDVRMREPSPRVLRVKQESARRTETAKMRGTGAGVLWAVCTAICRVNSFQGHRQHRDSQKVVTSCPCRRTRSVSRSLLPSWKLSRTGLKSSPEVTQLRCCSSNPRLSPSSRTCQPLLVDIRGLRSAFSALFFPLYFGLSCSLGHTHLPCSPGPTTLGPAGGRAAGREGARAAGRRGSWNRAREKTAQV